ncbi:hypothetical protein [Curtobacterium ammoniigenes]|uniref:hypothetical protein n=1 Tax=Curtobacterium ammoniigenes TaxID=395387 RepID=UPI00082AD85F|nr:hypothetical protein [Curtobacterium ammoniigenes]
MTEPIVNVGATTEPAVQGGDGANPTGDAPPQPFAQQPGLIPIVIDQSGPVCVGDVCDLPWENGAR